MRALIKTRVSVVALAFVSLPASARDERARDKVVPEHATEPDAIEEEEARPDVIERARDEAEHEKHGCRRDDLGRGEQLGRP